MNNLLVERSLRVNSKLLLNNEECVIADKIVTNTHNHKTYYTLGFTNDDMVISLVSKKQLLGWMKEGKLKILSNKN